MNFFVVTLFKMQSIKNILYSKLPIMLIPTKNNNRPTESEFIG